MSSKKKETIIIYGSLVAAVFCLLIASLDYYHDLSDKDKLIFEYKTGFGGKPVLDNAGIGKKLQMSPSTVSQRLKFITSRLAEGIE